MNAHLCLLDSIEGNRNARLMIDCGADEYITNSRSALIESTIKPCLVRIVGVEGEGNGIMAYERGDMNITVAGEKYILHNVIYAEHANISAVQREVSVNEPQVLLSVSKFARDTGFDVRLGTDTASFWRGDVCHASVDVSSGGLYEIDECQLKNGLPNKCVKRVYGEHDTENVDAARAEVASGGCSTTCSATPQPTKAMVSYNINYKEKGLAKKGVKKRKRKAERKFDFDTIVHNRWHQTNHFLKRVFKSAYGDKYKGRELPPCNACAWSKAKLRAKPKTARRKATKNGQKLHYDVFTAPNRSRQRYKYALIAIDEYSSKSFVIGLRNKSQVSSALIALIKKIEKKFGITPESLSSFVGKDSVVEIVRSDNAGENIVKSWKTFLEVSGIKLETSIAHQQWQNGKAERLGGVIMAGGQGLRYGGCMPYIYWYDCVCAFNYMRNRVPNSHTDKMNDDTLMHPLTPFSIWEDLDISPGELIASVRRIGCLLHVCVPKNQVGCGKKRAYSAVLLGYAEDNVDHAQKGYVVRRLSDSKVVVVAESQVWKFYENYLAYDDEETDDVPVDNHDMKEGESTDDSSDDSSDDSQTDDMTNDNHIDDMNNDNSDDAIENDNDPEDEDEMPLPMSETGEAYGKTSATGSRAVDVSDIDKNEHEHSSGEAYSSESHDELDKDDLIQIRSDMNRLIDEDKEKRIHNYELRQKRDDVSQDMVEYDRDNGKKKNNENANSTMSDTGLNEASGEDVEDSTRGKRLSSYEGANEEEEEKYAVDRITDVARKGSKGGGGLLFEVYWENYIDPTWEPYKNLSKFSTEILEGYLLNLSEEKKKKVFKQGEFKKILGDLKIQKDNLKSIDESQIFRSAASQEGGGSQNFDDAKKLMKRICLSVRNSGNEKVPSTLKGARRHSKWESFYLDMKKEFDAFNRKQAWTLTPRPDSNVVSVRWVFDIKMKDGVVTRYKARLVCRGFAQEEGVDYDPFQLYAPTMRIKSFRTLVALAATNDWNLRQYDVSCAFLHALLEETVYVEQPECFRVEGKEDWVYKLNRCMYGLKQSPRGFALHLASVLRKLGFVQSVADECLWSLQEGENVLYALYHVDDILMTGNNNDMRDTIYNFLQKELDIRDEGEANIFLGIKIIRDREKGSIALSQKHYIETMASRFDVTDDNVRSVNVPGVYGLQLSKDDLPVVSEEVEEVSKLPCPALIGSLIYVVKTRPDVAFAISDIARFMSKWSKKAYEQALHILKYLYSSRDEVLTYYKDSKLELVSYVDANYGDRRDTGEGDKWCSQGGYLIYLGRNLVSWSSKRHKCVTLSSMEAEYVEASRGAQEVVWFRKLMHDLRHTQDEPTLMLEDNKACISFSMNNTCHDRSKHIDIREHWLRQAVFDNFIKMHHIRTKEQIADVLTKYLPGPDFLRHRDSMLGGVVDHNVMKNVLMAYLGERSSSKLIDCGVKLSQITTYSSIDELIIEDVCLLISD